MPRPRAAQATGPAPVLALVVAAAFAAVLAGCVPTAPIGSLGPTLRFVDAPGGRIPTEHGIVVPTFEVQPRPRFDLDGAWRIETVTLDEDLSLADRARSLDAITREAGGRQTVGYDDSAWATVAVPGTMNPPPRGAVSGAWYRRHVAVPSEWADRSITLKFESAGYVVDVWVNGTWLGVHEGGAVPFAFDATAALRPGGDNVVAIRVDQPAPGSRIDTVPWGLIDWWAYGGLTGRTWLEASEPVRAARVDVVPHLDGADVSVVVENRSATTVAPDVRIDVYPADLTAANLLDPDPAALLPPLPAVPTNPRLPSSELGLPPGAPGRAPPPPTRTPVAAATVRAPSVTAGGAVNVTASLLVRDPALWDLGDPRLYVVEATVVTSTAVSAAYATGTSDTIVDTFGLRRIAVDPTGPRLLLNGRTAALLGAAAHDEVLTAAAETPGAPATATLGGPLFTAQGALAQLRRLQAVGANFVRTGHEPADPAILRLADRLGIAVWEEIPLYHFTPFTFDTAIERGIARQMLEEMALRDMNRPSVLFHGLSNESTGGPERISALTALRDADRSVDGTRLVGQAAYGFDAADGTSDPLDVVGITSYFGVFYGSDAESGTATALDAAHARYPGKPVMVLEFGHWADDAADEAAQVAIFRQTSNAIAPRLDTLPGGFVGAMTWWSLDDYLTTRPGITVERFGMWDAAGRARPVAGVASTFFDAVDTASRTVTRIPVRETPIPEPSPSPPVLGLVALTAALSVGAPLAILGLLALRGHRRSHGVRSAVGRNRLRPRGGVAP